MNEMFQVKVKKDFGKWALSITNNGRQWTSILLQDDINEIPLIIAELQRHLTQESSGQVTRVTQQAVSPDAESRCECKGMITFPGKYCPQCRELRR